MTATDDESTNDRSAHERSAHDHSTDGTSTNGDSGDPPITELPVTENLTIADRFLDQLVEGGDFSSIPMAEGLTFRGPMASATSAENYRRLCSDLASLVVGISLRTRVSEGNIVHLVYDVDMGLADGPLPTSQTIRFDSNRITDVEVIFDAARIPEAKA